MTITYHEPPEELSAEARDIHRAITSLVEELEAVDWYHQRVDVTGDESLKAILAHNRDEEIEHAAMTLEWLRRKLPKLDAELKTYLFTSVPVTEVEEVAAAGGGGEDAGAPDAGESGGLGIGSLRS